MTTQPVPMLSAAARKSLDRNVERSLRRRFGAAASLRKAVRLAATELIAGGASAEVVRALLTRSVEEHPQRPEWDRVSILTGLRTSEVLTRQILGWVGQRCTPTSAMTPSGFGIRHAGDLAPSD